MSFTSPPDLPDPAKIASTAGKAALRQAIIAYSRSAAYSRDAAQPIELKISEAARSKASEVRDLEQFFVSYQNFKARLCGHTAQLTVSCILHHLRCSHSLGSTTKSLAMTVHSTMAAKTRFSTSLENLYYLTLLLHFEEALKQDTPAEQIKALEAILKEVTQDHQMVLDNQSTKLNVIVKTRFAKSLVDIQKAITNHMESLQLEQNIAPITHSLENNTRHLHKALESLIRILQFLHAPHRDFVPIDKLAPAFAYPFSIATKTLEALREIVATASGKFLFAIANASDDTLHPPQLLAPHIETLSASPDSLSKLYKTEISAFLACIQETYEAFIALHNFLHFHQLMTTSAHAFGELILANHPIPNKSMLRHLKLTLQRMNQTITLAQKIEAAFSKLRLTDDRFEIVTQRLGNEVKLLSSLQEYVAGENRAISERLGKFGKRSYVRSVLQQFTAVAIYEAQQLKEIGDPECTEETILQLTHLKEQLDSPAYPKEERLDLDETGILTLTPPTVFGMEEFISAGARFSPTFHPTHTPPSSGLTSPTLRPPPYSALTSPSLAAEGSFRLTPAAQTEVYIEGLLYQPNILYEYEEQDVWNSLEACLLDYLRKNEGKSPSGLPVYTFAAVDTLSEKQLERRLKTDQAEHRGARITLIPCNIGRYHWVGLLFEFNPENTCIRAEFINSTHSRLPPTLQKQLSSVYPDLAFTERFDLTQQIGDGTSCGACTVQNLMLSMQRLNEAPTQDLSLLRAQHLHALRNFSEAPELATLDEPQRLREKQNRQHFFTAFEERQRLNKPTFRSTEFPSFKKSAPKSKSEILGMLNLASHIVSTPAPVCHSIRTALALKEANVKDVLDSIRTALWTHRIHANISLLSLLLFGLPLSVEQDEEHQKSYKDRSVLQFEYQYLEDLIPLLTLKPAELDLIRAQITSPPSSPPYASLGSTTLAGSTPPSVKRWGSGRSLLSSTPTQNTHSSQSSPASRRSSLTSLFRKDKPSLEDSLMMTMGMSPQEKLLSILCTAPLLKIMNKSNVSHPKGSKVTQSNKKALFDFIQRTPCLQKEKSLDKKNLSCCSFEELDELTILLLKITEESKETTKKELGNKLLEQLTLYLPSTTGDGDGETTVSLDTKLSDDTDAPPDPSSVGQPPTHSEQPDLSTQPAPVSMLSTPPKPPLSHPDLSSADPLPVHSDPTPSSNMHSPSQIARRLKQERRAKRSAEPSRVAPPLPPPQSSIPGGGIAAQLASDDSSSHRPSGSSSQTILQPAAPEKLNAKLRPPAWLDLIEGAKAIYIKRGRGKTLSVVSQLERALQASSPSKQMALFVHYILHLLGDKLDHASFRIILLTQACQHPGMTPWIYPGKTREKVSKETIFRATCDLILFHLGWTPKNKNDHPLGGFLDFFIIYALKQAMNTFFNTEKMKRIERLMELLTNVPIISDHGPLALSMALSQGTEPDKILETLHNIMQTVSTQPVSQPSVWKIKTPQPRQIFELAGEDKSLFFSPYLTLIFLGHHERAGSMQRSNSNGTITTVDTLPTT